jgi:pullulanase
VADILRRKTSAFVVWRPKFGTAAPVLVIGQFAYGNPPILAGERRVPLTRRDGFDDLFAVDASACGLTANSVYHYWFEVDDTSPGRPTNSRVLVTDPFAWTVDWRLRAPPLPAPYTDDDRQPASVIKWTGERLVACDPGGETPDFTDDAGLATLSPNNMLVIYELPTAWSKPASPADLGIGVGTFRDVLAELHPVLTGHRL